MTCSLHTPPPVRRPRWRTSAGRALLTAGALPLAAGPLISVALSCNSQDTAPHA